MNRIDMKFEELKKENKKALITFITAGDPNLEMTENLVLTMDKAGADIIEIGVPFSDPIAEGPVIQMASKRSLDNGTKLVHIFDLVKRLRENTEKPILLMLYLNSIFGFGTEKFFSLCNESGIDGVIVPDMPFEEKDEIQSYADEYKVHSISLVAPTSGDRIQKIAKNSKGFLYCVSSTGVTGTRNEFSTDFDKFFTEIKKSASIPYAVGFGISSPKQVREMKKYCDGVIIGSAIVKLVEKHKEKAEKPVFDFVKSAKMALNDYIVL